MEPLYDYAWLIPVFPLAGAMLVGLGLISLNKFTNGLRELNAVLIISTIGAAMVMSFALLISQFQGHPTYAQSFEWASAGNFHLNMGYTIDHLTSLMLVIVTTVALLVMIYTHGYMSHDKSYVRFYAYLSLFSSSMLGLVISILCEMPAKRTIDIVFDGLPDIEELKMRAREAAVDGAFVRVPFGTATLPIIKSASVVK